MLLGVKAFIGLDQSATEDGLKYAICTQRSMRTNSRTFGYPMAQVEDHHQTTELKQYSPKRGN